MDQPYRDEGYVSVRPAQDSDGASWTQFLEQTKHPLVSCHFNWRQLFPRERIHFLLAECEGETVGILPMIISGKGGYLKSPPLLSGSILGKGDPITTSGLLRAAIHVTRETRAEKISILSPEEKLHPFLIPRSPKTCTFILNATEGIDQIQREYSNSLRRNLRRACSRGVKAQMLPRDEIERFHMLHSASLERIGVEARPLSYFQSLADAFPDILHFAIATVDGNDAATLAFFSFGDTVTMLYGGWDYQMRRTNAESFIDNWAVEWGADNGYNLIDMGPSRYDPGDGSLCYKLRFGARIVPIFRHERWTSGSGRLKSFIHRTLRH